MPLPIAQGSNFQSSADVALASAARTTSGTINLPPLGGPGVVVVFEINVTAASGTTPTLQIALEDTFDGTNWNSVFNLAAANITTTGRTLKRVNLQDTPCTENVRLNYTIGGTTPSFTFAVNVYFARY